MGNKSTFCKDIREYILIYHQHYWNFYFIFTAEKKHLLFMNACMLRTFYFVYFCWKKCKSLTQLTQNIDDQFWQYPLAVYFKCTPFLIGEFGVAVDRSLFIQFYSILFYRPEIWAHLWEEPREWRWGLLFTGLLPIILLLHQHRGSIYCRRGHTYHIKKNNTLVIIGGIISFSMHIHLKACSLKFTLQFLLSKHIWINLCITRIIYKCISFVNR